ALQTPGDGSPPPLPWPAGFSRASGTSSAPPSPCHRAGHDAHRPRGPWCCHDRTGCVTRGGDVHGSTIGAGPQRTGVWSVADTGCPRPGAETTPDEPDRVRTRGGMLQMNAAPTTTLFERLKAAARTEWEGYTHHSFVEQLGEGTLPLAAFQDYLVQDYMFLINFARANALAAYKSRSLADVQASSDALGAILTETELHVRITEEWGIDRPTLEAAPEKQATVA